MKLTFRLIEEKADKSGLCPVFIDFTYSGKRLRAYTGEKCKPSEWEPKKMRFRRSFDGYLSANDYLENLSVKLHSAYRSFVSSGIVPTPGELRELIKPRESIKEKTLIQEFESFVSEKKRRFGKTR
ncbi:Arm DNA-binding domain-containing protein [Runella slithyformis]|uniref:Arm DNA-binding domain-containing protein n=1 Tax=Runella slithyformis TaxID=106 RepID=UPI00146AE773|nr:Arm DNA-binding domain-containing protein [Runella slithyformis]